MGRPLSGWTKRHKKTFGTRKKKWDGNFRQPPKPKYYWTVKIYSKVIMITSEKN